MDLDLSLDGRYILNNVLDCAIQELDMILDTECCELLGDPYFGVSMEQFLWQLTPSANEIEKYIYDKIAQYTFFCNNLKTKIDIEIQNGTLRLIYIIKITLYDYDGNAKTNTWTYK